MPSIVEIELTIADAPALELEVQPVTLDLGALDVGMLVPVIPSNYGLITWDGHVLTVS